MKPGQRLHIVNQLYQYTVQFKEDPTGDQGGTKRPRESSSGDRKSHKEAQSVKAVKETEKESVSASKGDATKNSVRGEWLRMCMCLPCCFYNVHVSIVIFSKKHVTLNLLQEGFGHWSQGLKASMQDPKVQVLQLV